MINCVIIEDEPLAQRGLTNLIHSCDNLSLINVFDNVADFLDFRELNNSIRIDLIFLDIELPGQNGIDYLRACRPDSAVILTTAYTHFALEAYELNVLDYLLKPISKERFSQSVSKAENYIHYLKSKKEDQKESIYIRSEKVMERVYFNEIILVEAMRNHVIYHCEKRKLISYSSLKNAEQELPADRFLKIQKSFIINKSKVEKIEKGYVYIHNRSIAINRHNRSEIVKKLLEQ